MGSEPRAAAVVVCEPRFAGGETWAIVNRHAAFASVANPMPKSDTAARPFRQGPLLDFVGYHIRLAQLVVFDDFMKGQPEPMLTPGQFAMLVLIHENPGLTQQTLAQRIGIDKSTLTLALNRLAERRLLRRVRSASDRRSNVLELTPTGTAHMRRMITFVKRHERRLLKRLSDAERRQLVGLLDKMIGLR